MQLNKLFNKLKEKNTKLCTSSGWINIFKNVSKLEKF